MTRTVPTDTAPPRWREPAIARERTLVTMDRRGFEHIDGLEVRAAG